MSEFQIAADSFPIWKALLWVFYPMFVLVAVEVLLRSVNDDDDDDFGGGRGVRVTELQPAYSASGA
tara:strand:- start:460 stop:657 length:198 start_codon:yes stop_codon:yes gene_type:complete